MWLARALPAGASVAGQDRTKSRRCDTLIVVGLALMAFFFTTDAIATQFCVSHGYAQEGNSLAAGLVAHGQFVWLKCLGLIACLVLLGQLYKRFPRLATVTSLSAALFYVGVLLWNAAVLTRF